MMMFLCGIVAVAATAVALYQSGKTSSLAADGATAAQLTTEAGLCVLAVVVGAVFLYAAYKFSQTTTINSVSHHR